MSSFLEEKSAHTQSQQPPVVPCAQTPSEQPTNSPSVDADQLDTEQQQHSEQEDEDADEGEEEDEFPSSVAVEPQQSKPTFQKKGSRNSIVQFISKARINQHKHLEYVSKMHRQNSRGSINLSKKVYLARGGTYVPTVDGPVQIGLPPETIKDVMKLGLTLPQVYVLPKSRFNLEMGLNVAEFEFPAYYNFFFKRRRVHLVLHKEAEPLIRTIFRETLLGPEKIEWPQEYSEDIPKEMYPDLEKELSKFCKNPFNPSTNLSVDTLIQFSVFDDEGVANISEHVTIKDCGDEYSVLENGVEITRASSEVILINPHVEQREEEETGIGHNSDSESADEQDKKEQSPCSQGDKGKQNVDVPYFIPPYFGITMLGNSDGFDMTGTTTGFVVWMNRRGIMVDPPPYSGALLKKQGIHPRLIRGIILTHCHADHDAGTFQKILEEGRITLFTTEVIMGSFLRKYSAISGLDIPFLQKLFVFRPVVVGERTCVYGGFLKFFYSLHAIPCVGFAAYSNGKSMVYSADTFNDEAGIKGFYEGGYMSEGRRDALLNFPWHHDVILHEAGVPPIHTPLSTFEKLDEETKKRLYIVHKPAKDVPKEKGLQAALVGPENTIVISNEQPPNALAAEILDLVGSIELFSSFPISKGLEMVQCASIRQFEKGQMLIEEGQTGSDMFIISLGVVEVKSKGVFVKNLTVGDFFGEASACVPNLKRSATIVATCPVTCILFSRNDFLHLIRNTDTLDRIRKLNSMQNSRNWQVMNSNSVLSNLSSAQKTHLQSIFEIKVVKEGEKLWEAGSIADQCILVDTGLYAFARAQTLEPFSSGAFVGEVHAILDQRPLTTTLLCVEEGEVFYISRQELLHFLEENPGFLLYFLEKKFVE
eukprot:CAMPEP_0175137714 /NCGR_PEP_ID=MMETSP0087-20121206/9959_1 /TAXON_ID=136419 /ORGANISM="Unknown Unknown, Strain D1" /LENGTH=874 /DNA_ID=CAMNT_0016420561 /DNA_START=311 /DNA_END=2935 /DNA_ORIENTATION=-